MNYYDVLGIQRSESKAGIKAAYKKRSLELHPDRNKAKDAHAKFIELQLAYDVLSNQERRALYDIDLDINQSGKVHRQTGQPTETNLNPIICSVCNKVTAQPRYVNFYWVISLIFITSKSGAQGIYCAECVNTPLIKSTVKTLFLGWWGFPWGPIYTLQALFNNLRKGKRPSLPNAYLLAHQALYFYQTNQNKIGYAVSLDAKHYFNKASSNHQIGKYSEEQLTSLKGAKALIEQLDMYASKDDKGPRLDDQWKGVSSAVAKLLTVFIIFILGGIGFFYQLEIKTNSYDSIGIKNTKNVEFKKVNESSAVVSNTEAIKNERAAVLPPFGVEWPEFAGYVPGTDLHNLNGLASITIDNIKNDFAIFAKLVDIKNNKRVRQVFIPANETFDINALARGNYDIRFKNIETGSISKTGVINLINDDTGIIVTVTGVFKGNLELESIRENEF